MSRVTAEHIQRSNRVRTLRSEWRRTATAAAAADLIACPPAWADKMRVRTALKSVPWVNPDIMLERVGLGPADTVGHIDYAARRELVARLTAIARGLAGPQVVTRSHKRWSV